MKRRVEKGENGEEKATGRNAKRSKGEKKRKEKE